MTLLVHLASMGFMNEQVLRIGISIVIARNDHLRPNTELHLFFEQQCCRTVVPDTSEDELKLSAARERERKRREQAIAKAEAALQRAAEAHKAKVEEIGRDRAVLDRQLEVEKSRWETQKEKLEAALRQARNPGLTVV
ncbi:hypothetical protein BH10PSE7_BH10PSE7_33290 [soil metagenome]